MRFFLFRRYGDILPYQQQHQKKRKKEKTPPSMLRAKVPRMDLLKKHRRRRNCTDGSVLFNASLVELQVSEAFHSTQSQTQANVQLDHTLLTRAIYFCPSIPKGQDKLYHFHLLNSIRKLQNTGAPYDV